MNDHKQYTINSTVLVREPSARESIAYHPVRSAPEPRQDSYNRDWYKRYLDLFLLVAAHVILAPLWVILWALIPLAIWLEDRGPVFYRQTRLGKNGKHFLVVKFRTMVPDAEKYTGAIWSTENDPRITRVGRVLRKFRLDEMPQMINIFKGEMSFVGPRPERPELAEEFCRTVPNFHSRLRVRPGIAGLAQARGRYATRPKDKLRYDNLYIRTLNPLMDIRLLVQSIWVAVKGDPHKTKA